MKYERSFDDDENTVEEDPETYRTENTGYRWHRQLVFKVPEGQGAVAVLIKRTLADVQWNCMSLSPELDPAVCGDRDLESILVGVIDTVRQKRSLIMWTTFSGIITDLPIDHATIAAKAINWHLQTRVRRYKKILWNQELAKSIDHDGPKNE